VSGRIDARFASLARHGRKGLIPFVTAGDPHPEGTVALMHAMVEAGADLIELGMPFSDPVADGPVIQQASERAIGRRVGIGRILDWVAEFRQRDAETPVVLMGYLNPVEIYGAERFAQQARAAGVDGVLIVDVPVEESDTLAPLRAAGIEPIFLVAPTTTDARLAAIREQAAGFVYHVSLTGVTGAGQLDAEAVRRRVGPIKQGSDIPVAVGFGIRDAASAARIAQSADAVVIGSALVERLAAAPDAASAGSVARAFLAPIRAALDAACAA
jgi:tryptophan synthase alpha chain